MRYDTSKPVATKMSTLGKAPKVLGGLQEPTLAHSREPHVQTPEAAKLPSRTHEIIA